MLRKRKELKPKSACNHWLVTTHLFHLPPNDVGTITLLSAMPTGANAYVVASRWGKAEASVSGAVALSTLLSMITITTVLAFVGP